MDAQGHSQNLTYANIGCQGITRFGLAASVTFPTDLICQADPATGTAYPDRAVSTTFHTEVESLDDFILGVNLPPFAIPGLDGFTFACENIVFDHSSTQSSPLVAYPNGYESSYIGGDVPLWEGFYAGNIQVTLPSQFNKAGSQAPLTLAARGLVIDANGISGTFAAENLLTIDQGSASGWKFSVDRFALGLEANTLMNADFAGSLHVPVASESTLLGYEGFFDLSNNYYILVGLNENLNFDVLQAKATLLPNSFVKLAVQDGQFRPEANLNGEINMAVAKEAKAAATSSTAASGKKTADFKGIKFQNLHLQTVKPYVTTQYFGYENDSEVADFPVQITRLGLQSENDRLNFFAGLQIDFGVGKAGGGFSLYGQMEEQSHRQRWKYDHIHIDDVVVAATVAEVFALDGRVSFRENDPEYGDGFAGSLSMKFMKGLDFSIAVSAAFGNTDQVRYWYADANAEFSPAIPICGYVNMGGFSGGASMGMAKSARGVAGMSANAYDYYPDPKSGLGIKAGMKLVIPDAKTVSINAMLELQFNRKGGLNLFGLYGHAEFLSGSNQTSDSQLTSLMKKADAVMPGSSLVQNAQSTSDGPSQSGMSADVAIEYDFTNNCLDANFELYANMLDGMLTGTGSNGRAGWTALHVKDKNDWYLRMGIPSNPIGLKLNLLGKVGIEASAYFMTGCDMPDPADPPLEVTEILNLPPSRFSQARSMAGLSNFGSGKGLAFGSNFKVDTGDLFFLILYANFKAGIGFDLMLKDYGAATCKGSSDPIGMNGWYANGQAYTYLAGEAGVGVDLFFFKGKIPVIKAGTAAILQGQLPNPAYFTGAFGMSYNLLGGLVKGNMNFEFELGDKCDVQIPGASPLDFEVIAGCSPEGTDADVFANPQIAFNVAVNTQFRTELDGESTPIRIVLGKREIRSEKGVIPVGQWCWKDPNDKTRLNFVSEDILDPNTRFIIDVEVNFEYYRNGQWQTLYSSGEVSSEKHTFAFTTGEAPDYIPLSNVAYLYPVADQQHFHPAEYGTGFVQLVKGQDYLFASDRDFDYKAEFLTENGMVSSRTLRYDAQSNTLRFAVPSDLPLATVMNLRLAGYSRNATSEGGIQYTEHSTGDGSYSVGTRQADTQINEGGTELLAYAFATSRFKSFKDRLKATQWDDPYFNSSLSGISNLNLSTKRQEPYDLVELKGDTYSGGRPLIQLRSAGTDSYYTRVIKPLVYDHSPYQPTYSGREGLGVPPLEAVVASEYYCNFGIRDQRDWVLNDYFPWTYDLAKYYYHDWRSMLCQAWDHAASQASQAYSQQANVSDLPDYTNGKYPVVVEYKLPDGTVTTSEKVEYLKR